MADIVISIVAKVAEYLVTPVIEEGKYLLCGNEVIKNLENEKELLTFELDSLKDRVKRTQERAEEIAKPVEKWLNDVKNVLEEATDLEQMMRANTNCFPTWRRYRLCKQMGEKIKAMEEFKGKSNIEPFSYRLPLPGIQYQPSENFIYFESTKVVYDQLLEALQDDSIYMIGVYGMGGCGKTTLVNEVGKNAERLNLFDKVISITVSQTPNIRKIQGIIADMLEGLELTEESTPGRAQHLWLSLKNKKRILIIVDDLWGEFDLREIGICLDNDYKGRWKVVVTTRHLEVCNLMDCQKKIHVDFLSIDESWTLFQKHAKIDNAFSRSLNDVPWELCKECNGLPIAIVAIASSLIEQSKVEWEVALHYLKHSETFDDHMEKGMGVAINCVKLSYDYLKNKEAKMLFLMCSMFPEDYLISIEDLIRYAVGLGLGGRSSLELARSRIEAGINKLLHSCLLMQAKERKTEVKMHDVVRDVALWIAKWSDDHKILVNLDKPLTDLEEDDGMRDYFAVSSWYVENQISIQLDAPNLEILLLNTRSLYLFDLSNANFEGVEGLKVFHLTNNHFIWSPLSLPQSMSLLTNLKTLRLTKWHLGDITFVTSLTRLEVLVLEGCSFNELPHEMGKLKRLKLLDLSYCILQKNYNGAIGKCSQLEEFYAVRFNTCECIPDILRDISTLPKLQRFAICENSVLRASSGPLRNKIAESRRVVELCNANISSFKETIQKLLRIADTVRLARLRGRCKNFIPDLVGATGGMNYLTDLRLVQCAEIECIFDATSHPEIDTLIPTLVELWLSGLVNLKELCRGPVLSVSHFFETLEKLNIFDCYKLHNIFPRDCKIPNLKFLTIENRFPRCELEVLFSMPVVQSLLQLEKLTIKGCKELKHLIASEREHVSDTSQEIVSASRNSHFVMPKLKEVNISNCYKLECIFPICCCEGLVQLQSIKIDMAPKLKYVFGEYDHEGNSCVQCENHIMTPHLEVLELNDFENLIGICPGNYRAMWPSHWKLTVKNCPKFTTSQILIDGSEQRYGNIRNKKGIKVPLQQI